MAHVRNLIALSKGIHDKIVVQDNMEVRHAMRLAARLNYKHGSVGRIHIKKQFPKPMDIVFDFVK